MALTKCTECGHEVSDRASVCPNCGCPITKMEQNNAQKDNTILTPPKKNKIIYYIGGIVGYILLSTIASALLREEYTASTSIENAIAYESMICASVASIIIFLIAKPWRDKMMFSLMAILISIICSSMWQQLMYGTAILQFLSHFTLIVFAVIRRR